MPMQNTAICILGMHRSGTSCLAGCLEERGLELGDVVNAAPHNLKGNKENIALRSINDDVLTGSDGAWDIPPVELKWNDALRHRRDSHLEAFAEFPIWGFKDPRTLLSLPFWQESGQSMKFVGTFRHPAAVVRSLLVRKGLQPRTPPVELWKSYNRKLLEFHKRSPFPLVSFDLEQDSYLQAVSDIASGLGLPENTRAISFYEDIMRNEHSCDQGDSQIDAECQSIYAALKSRQSTRT